MTSNTFRQGRLALAVTTLLALAAAPAAHANITTSGGASFRTGSPTPTLTITAPITFTIASSGLLYFLVFDEWVTADTERTGASPSAAQTMSYKLDGVAGTSTLMNLRDNLATAGGPTTANDGYLGFSGFAVTAGQTLTINAQSFTFNAAAAFNPNIPTAFNGNVFMGDGLLNAMTNSVSVAAVPEPSTWALMAAGACGLALHRQRRAKRG